MSNSSKYGYTSVNYINCCPKNIDGTTYVPPVKTIIVSAPESQHMLKLISCYKTCKYVPPINEGIKHGSYDRVLRRRRGRAFKQ